MKKKLLVSMVIMMFSLGMVGMANATLIGDYVTAQFYYPDSSTPIGGGASATVVAGASDTMEMIPGLPHSTDVNVESDSILIDFVMSGYFPVGAGGFSGLVVGDLNDSSGDPLIGVTIDTNWGGWDSSRLSFTDDSVAFNWGGLSAAANSTYFNVALEFGPGGDPVPEPSTILLMGAGLLGMAGYGRKRMVKKS